MSIKFLKMLNYTTQIKMLFLLILEKNEIVSKSRKPEIWNSNFGNWDLYFAHLQNAKYNSFSSKF